MVAKKKPAKKKAVKKKAPRKPAGRPASTGPIKDTTRQERIETFCRSMIEGDTQAEAFMKAFPSARKWKKESVYVNASKYMDDANVSLRFAEIQKEHRERTYATVDRVLEESSRIAFFNPKRLLDEKGEPIPLHKLPDDVAAVIAGMTTARKGDNSYIDRLKLVSKKDGLDILAKWLKMFSESHIPAGGTGGQGGVSLNLNTKPLSAEDALRVYEQFKNA